jgi:hypothetical protein
MFASKAVMFGNVFEIQPIDMARFTDSWSEFNDFSSECALQMHHTRLSLQN